MRQGDVVWTPFPFVEIGVLKARPALIVSSAGIGSDASLFWAVMITSAARAKWPGDIPVDDLPRAGLPIPSCVRTAKIATLEHRLARRIGDVEDVVIAAVLEMIRMRLAPH